MADYKKMSDDDIIDTVQRVVQQSVGFNDTKLSDERVIANKYYNAETPFTNVKGRSKYVSQDVYDSVESLKATLLETFAAGNDIGEFEPRGREDVAHCYVAARYVDHVLFEQNDIFSVWSDQIHDGLLARIGVLKVRWDKHFEDGEEEFDKITEVAFAQLLEEDGVEPIDVKTEMAPDGYTPLYSGTIRRRKDCSQVRIEALAPETFFIESRAANPYTATVGDYQRLSKAQLLSRGISQAKIDRIDGRDDKAFSTDQEVAQRHDESGVSSTVTDNAVQDQVEKVRVFETYVDLDVEGTGATKLWRIMYAGDTLLEKEVVKRRPYIYFVPLRIPHKAHGDLYARRIYPTQNANTMLMRGVLDHTAITNNPRLTVLKGTVNDARELIDNRYGGIVNINRPDGVKALEQPPLNPFVFQTMQLIDYKNEGYAAVSKLSQGLNKDAISKQNSAAMIEQITTMSMARQKIIARRFANDVVKRLYELVYDIVRENETRARILPIAGQWVEVNPAMWSYGSRPFRVTLALGYGEKERQVAEWMGLHQTLSTDPSMAQQYTPVEKFNVFTRVFELKGRRDIQAYIKPPDQITQPEPDPVETAKVQIAGKEADAKATTAQATLIKAQADAATGAAKVQQKMTKDEGDHAIKADAQDLKEKQFEHDKRVDDAELRIADKAADAKVIVSPN